MTERAPQSRFSLSVIQPDWPAPPRIRAFTTLRQEGVSEAPWDSLNLGSKTGDDSGHVRQNRAILAQNLPSEPRWLRQEHGTRVVLSADAKDEPAADAIASVQPNEVCAVLTADCLPVLLCREDGSAVAAVHAGWRGLVSGILTRAVDVIDNGQTEIMAWLGPAIGPSAYQVRSDFRDRFLKDDNALEPCFTKAGAGYWYADLYAIARHYLTQSKVRAIFGGSHCTFSEESKFFSYRRDGRTGRMASVIWIDGG